MSIISDSTILGIQFSILSPEEIRRISVVEVTSKDTYVNNKAVVNGLFDPRMGTLEPGTICPTDGLSYIQTPGYFGHIEMARPVFYIQYLDTILEILKTVCIKCSKLLIDKTKYSGWLTLTNDKRWKKIYGLTGGGKVKRCGERNEGGCGCKQPRYKKDGFATIMAEWNKDKEEKVVMKLTPELVIKIFKRIADEDVAFMGFSPVWSRPEWMVCQVLAVPPPAVRPSVKHDAQQRSEDDLSHILIQIIKTNKSLAEKMRENSSSPAIDEEHLVLQYFVATLINNKLSGAQPAAQRSGRAFKSIEDRLTGKNGRVRGNLMGKRVDSSARSVITPDPNLSIQELGVPLKIAQNITKPVRVNARNKAAMMLLVQNGPDVYPGAKIVEKHGTQISLRYADRVTTAQSLQDGDIVHRHMVDGDVILFNRQPTLHRMSMMGHIARIMQRGDTFRMNVGDTKPYNADFDGDEMNMHMPQDVEAETELRYLAAVPFQIVSPASNKPIIGIFQDSLLGANQFTRLVKGRPLSFTPREAMALTCGLKELDVALFSKPSITSFEIISQLIPPLSVRAKSKSFVEGSKEGLIEIVNGVYLSGQMDSGVLSSTSSGLIHRIFNDFGNYAAADFIDNLQYVVNEFMKTRAYSVGVSDLLSNSNTTEKILQGIDEKKQSVARLIQSTLGEGEPFKNETGQSNCDELESRITEILGKANQEAGNIGIENLDKDNRFVIMVRSGSKGSTINIAQMISCLGQQQVEGKRIPYGFDQRTLPHFSRFDDSPKARGFIEASFIGGLTPADLFFHAMGGRIGLIDTAVKTSTTGYIQRKLIKGLEDLVATYDGTVRNSKNKIIQFRYGEDNMDACKVEEQVLPLWDMTVEQIYNHFHTDDVELTPDAEERAKEQLDDCREMSKVWVTAMLRYRDESVRCVFQNVDEKRVRAPVAFMHLINGIGRQANLSGPSDMTPLEMYEHLDLTYSKLESMRSIAPTELFRALYYYYLSPRELLVRRFNKDALDVLLGQVVLQYKRAAVNPGEMVGIIAAQSIGEPTTQLTLNTFHFAGVASKSTVTRGMARVEEVLSLSPNPKNPSMTVFLKTAGKDHARDVKSRLEHTRLEHVVASTEIFFDSDDSSSDAEVVAAHKAFEDMVKACGGPVECVTKSNWVIRLELDDAAMHDTGLTMDDVNFAIHRVYGTDVSCIYSDYNADKLVFRIRLSTELAKKKIRKNLDDLDNLNRLKAFEDELLGLTIRGVDYIEKVVMRPVKNTVEKMDGNYKKTEIFVLDTVGTNLVDVLGLPYVDASRTVSNDIKEMYNVLGIEAARESIYNELTDVLEADGYINAHHKMVLCDRMTSNAQLVSMFRSGINGDDIGPLAKASFEETPEMFLKAAKFAELDIMRGVSANVMCGQEGYYGTSIFDVLLDMDAMTAAKEVELPTVEIKDTPCRTINVRNVVDSMLAHPKEMVDDEYVLDL
jgi:DNA-directed RNA polymerase II subunit RPB1